MITSSGSTPASRACVSGLIDFRLSRRAITQPAIIRTTVRDVAKASSHPSHR